MPTPVTLRIVVTIDGESIKAQRATVELMDDMGNGSRRGYTDDSGNVTFQALTGVLRVRITGPGIQPYEGEIDIAPVEMSHMERIRVHRILGAIVDANPAQPIAAVRLNIPDPAKKLFEKGSEAMRKEHWEESSKRFEEAIQKYPDYDMAYNGLGVAKAKLNDNAAAKQAFAKAVDLNPKYAEAQRNLARLLIAEHKNDDALQLLKKSLETEPSDAWALGNAAYLDLQTHNFEEALAFAQKVHSVPHPNMPQAHMIAGYAAKAMGKADVAAEEFRTYLAEDPKGPNVVRAREELGSLALLH